jgi:hypothetical protein
METTAQRFGVEASESAIVAKDQVEFIQGIRTLVKQRARREAMGAAARAQMTGPTSWDRTFAELCNAYDAAMSMTEGENPTPFAFSPA